MADLARVLINGTQIIDGSRNLENVVSINGITATEISYLDDVTSSIQTQINTINLGMPTELDDFIDVTITTPSNGDILYYVTDKFINGSLADAGIASATHDHSGVYLESMGALNDLSDVNADSPSDNQVLSWDASSSKWIAETVGAGVTNIGDLTDVTMAVDLADNDLLVYVTDHWENQTLAEAGLASATHNHDSDYADISHDHDLTYSAITHDHSGTYLENITSEELADLSDVSEVEVANGEILAYYTDHWENRTLAELGISATTHNHSGVYLESMGTLDDLSNTNLTSVSDNDLLQYDTTSSKWINISIGDAGIATTGDLHSAVTIGTANGLSISTQELSLALASTSTTGALSNTDWNTFNGKQDALTFGIANTNAVKIDMEGVADNDFAKFTSNGVEGRSYAEVKQDLSLDNVENTAISTWAGSANITTVGIIGTGTWQGTAIGDTYISSAATWSGKQDALTFGIANTNAVKIDDADAAENDYCKLTTTGIVGRSYSEVKTDLSLSNVENTAISSWAGSSNIVTVGTLTSGNVDGAVTDATTSAKGKVELAIASEVDTGTSTSLAVTPDALAGSNLGKRTVQIAVTAPDAELEVGDGAAYFVIPPELNGMNLVDADAAVITASSSANPEICVYNVTDSHNMLSGNIYLDVSAYTSYTASSQPVINTDYDDVATGDIIRIDIDATGTGTKGLIVTLSFQLP